MSEPVEIQVSYRVNAKKFKTREAARAAVKRAREHFLATGESIPGVTIIGKWRNPARLNPARAIWKTTEDIGQSLQEFWETFYAQRGLLALMRGPEDPVNIKQKRKRKRVKKSSRKNAMVLYHAAIRKIQWENPGLSYKMARKQYKR